MKILAEWVSPRHVTFSPLYPFPKPLSPPPETRCYACTRGGRPCLSNYVHVRIINHYNDCKNLKLIQGTRSVRAQYQAFAVPENLHLAYQRIYTCGLTPIFIVLKLYYIVVEGARCKFPSDWKGKYFQSGLGNVVIRDASVTTKGSCVDQHRDYFLFANTR